MIYHGNRRLGLFAPSVVALPLYQMFSHRVGAQRYASRFELREAFRLAPETPIILSGTDKDRPLERWWSLGPKRRVLIRALRNAGVVLVTTPNYSVFTDLPRWDNLYSVKRIGLVHREFLDEGLSSALHVNGRTETDFLRWTDYIAARSEVTHLAYEFGTGAGWVGRRLWHAEQLAGLQRAVGRPLHLLIRGGIEVLPTLTAAFANISVLDTSAFIKTMKRRRAIWFGKEQKPKWVGAPTMIGAPLDRLLDENFHTIETWLGTRAATSPTVQKAAATQE